PFYPLAQLKYQLGTVLVPRPFGREIGHDRVDAVLPDLRIERDEIVEHPQHRPLGEDRLLLVDRHAGRAVDRVDLQDTAMFLRLRRVWNRRRKEPSAADRKNALTEHHLRLLTRALGGLSRLARASPVRAAMDWSPQSAASRYHSRLNDGDPISSCKVLGQAL